MSTLERLGKLGLTAIFAAAAASMALSGCSPQAFEPIEEAAEQTLDQQGFSNIRAKYKVAASIYCAKHEVGVAFTATTPAGQRVDGVTCHKPALPPSVRIIKPH